MDSNILRIEKLEAEIASLPAGYISRKTIRGKVKQYYQWTEAGKKRSKYLDDATAEELRVKIERRRELQKELHALRASVPVGVSRRNKESKRAIGASVPVSVSRRNKESKRAIRASGPVSASRRNKESERLSRSSQSGDEAGNSNRNAYSILEYSEPPVTRVAEGDTVYY